MLLGVKMGENLKYSSFIISKASSRPNFYRWSEANGTMRKIENILLTFKILASVDISLLYILDSNLAGSSIFIFTISVGFKIGICQCIFWNIFTGDFTRIIIQVSK